MNACNVLVQPPYAQVQIEITRDADWDDSLPVLMDGDVPLDLSANGRILELYVRPEYDHVILIKKLTSTDPDGADGVRIDDAARGLASIFVPRADVIADLPAGRWRHFLVLKEQATEDPLDGFLYREIWRGPLLVWPGNVA